MSELLTQYQVRAKWTTPASSNACMSMSATIVFESAVLACLRLARMGRDYLDAAIFLRELEGVKLSKRVLAEDMRT